MNELCYLRFLRMKLSVEVQGLFEGCNSVCWFCLQQMCVSLGRQHLHEDGKQCKRMHGRFTFTCMTMAPAQQIGCKFNRKFNDRNSRKFNHVSSKLPGHEVWPPIYTLVVAGCLLLSSSLVLHSDYPDGCLE